MYSTNTLYNSINGSSIEDTFIHNHVHNLLASVFLCYKIFLQEWANSTLEVSNHYKHGWIASIKSWKTKYNTVVAEINLFSKTNRGVISDFLILGRQMKVTLEQIIDNGAADPRSYGILFQGGDMTLYTMDLKYPGIYRFIELDVIALSMRF